MGLEPVVTEKYHDSTTTAYVLAAIILTFNVKNRPGEKAIAATKINADGSLTRIDDYRYIKRPNFGPLGPFYAAFYP